MRPYRCLATLRCVSLIRNILSPGLHRLRRAVEFLGAIAPGTPAAARFASFGTASLVAFPQATIFGEQGIHIGTEVLVGRSCTLSLGYGLGDPNIPARGLVIGDRCIIGAGATITAHEGIEIGSDVWFGQAVFVSDASHGYQDPHTPIGQQLGQHAPVSIGAGSWIGHGAMILPGSRIGCNVVVGAGSVVRGEVADHCVVAGVPARVVRHLEPGLGWVGARGDVKPIWSTADMAELLAGAED